MSHDRISRRSLLKGALLTLAATPAASLVARDAFAAAPLVDPNDAQAKGLGYTHDATKVDAKARPTWKAGAHCANCALYTGAAGSAQGPCSIFPGKEVKAAGWCAAWALKPGAKLG
jgi:hypothetical protein